MSKLVRLPRWIDVLLSHDRVAYPFHVIFGDFLNWLHAPPSVVGPEWLKAAAHADSKRALQRVAKRLAVARRRAANAGFDAQIGAAVVRRVTCDGQDVTMRRPQLAVLERAGVSVPTASVTAGLSDRVSESQSRR